MSEVEKLVERLNARAAEHRVSLQRTADAEEGDWCAGLPPEVAGSMKDDAQLDEQAASTLKSQARRVEELEGALREAADVARMTAYHIEKTKRPTNGHRAMWIASLAPIARSALSEGSGSSRGEEEA